jgi:hypothetical protein
MGIAGSSGIPYSLKHTSPWREITHLWKMEKVREPETSVERRAFPFRLPPPFAVKRWMRLEIRQGSPVSTEDLSNYETG